MARFNEMHASNLPTNGVILDLKRKGSHSCAEKHEIETFSVSLG